MQKRIKKVISLFLSIAIFAGIFAISVSAAAVTIETEPTRNTFYEGKDWRYSSGKIVMLGDLDIGGTVLSYNGKRVTYSVGKWGANMYAKLPSGASYTLGTNKIYIYADEFSSTVYAEYNITLVALKSISLACAPTKTKLVMNYDWSYDSHNYITLSSNAVALDGSKITAVYKNGVSEVISYSSAYAFDWEIPEEVNDLSLGANKFDLIYGSCSVTFTLDIVKISAVTLYSAPDKTNYYYLDDWSSSSAEPDLSGMAVTVQYSDSSKEKVTYESSPSSFSAAFSGIKRGKNKITVKYCANYSFTCDVIFVSYGDINFDGIVNSVDALYVLEAATQQRTLTGYSKLYADVDNSGAINSTDALYILQFATGAITAFKAEN